MTKKQYKNHIKKSIEELAFPYLTSKKLKHKKVKKLRHNSLKMADYLEPNNINIKQSEAQTLFKLKSKMVDVKANYPTAFRNNINCTLCEKEGNTRKDSQKHILKCPVIKRKILENEKFNYKDLTSESLKYQIRIVKRFQKNYLIRKQLHQNMKEPI